MHMVVSMYDTKIHSRNYADTQPPNPSPFRNGKVRAIVYPPIGEISLNLQVCAIFSDPRPHLQPMITVPSGRKPLSENCRTFQRIYVQVRHFYANL